MGTSGVQKLGNWDRETILEVQKLWKHLSIHYDLHQTVCEIRICLAYWDEYVEIFWSSYQPLQDGITLGLETDGPWGSLFPQLDEEDDAWNLPKLTRLGVETIKTMRLSGLAKVEVRGKSRMKDILVALAHIELPRARNVEVCFGAETFLLTGDQDGDAHVALQTGLQGTSWVICGHCM
ncbi:hypothetical protein MVEN_00379000 [Mycena venus]|uniref:Uncharacterized protein n=1 Tax=Mycena venus TaxID=2733690 RepID=A0A8H6YRS9_9AGAR|nr:hypothetical protein MVEN_00379000 [Mycena venus]